MSEDYVRVPVDSLGKMLRAILRTIGINKVYDEVVEVARGTDGVVVDPLQASELNIEAVSKDLQVDVKTIPAITGAVTTDALKAADLNIQAVTKDLQVDVLTLPAITGAVTTDALKASELNIDAAEKLLEVAINDAVSRLLMNSILGKMQTDVAGRLLVKIDIGGTATPVTTASHAVTVVAGGIALGAIATGGITDLPYKGQDHEKVLADMAFMGIRSRMEFSA